MKQQTARAPSLNGIIKINDIAAKLQLNKTKIKQKVKQMQDNRLDYEKRWKSIRDYQLPYIGYFDDTADKTNPARRRDNKIYNGVAWESCQIFAAGIMSGLTPPSRQWFRFSFQNRQLTDNSDAGKILDQRLDIMNDVLNKSNFYNSIHSNYLELPFGQAPLATFADSKVGVHFIAFTIGTYYYECGSDGMVNTFLSKTEMTAVQLADKFGTDNLPVNIQNELSNNSGMSKKHTVYWLIEPNTMAYNNKLDKFSMPYISLYWLENSNEKEWLDIGGFQEFPIAVARYLVTGNDTYAKGPGWFAEGDSKGLQLLEKDDITAVELGIKPPMQATSETAMKGINLVPGGKTITENADTVKPLFQVNINLQHLNEKIEKLEDKVKKSYSADLFRMLEQMDKTMTAREVIERTQEKMQQLGPVVQRMQFEFLSRIIERVYNILDRAGIFPQVEDPNLQQILNGEEIKIEYISPLAQAQKMSGLVNIEQAFAFTAQVAQADPTIWYKVDLPETVNRYYDLLGAPATMKRSDDDYKKSIQQIQEQQQQKEQQAQALQLAQAAAPAAQAAKNATDAANDGNPAMREWLGYNTGGISADG